MELPLPLSSQFELKRWKDAMAKMSKQQVIDLTVSAKRLLTIKTQALNDLDKEEGITKETFSMPMETEFAFLTMKEGLAKYDLQPLKETLEGYLIRILFVDNQIKERVHLLGGLD